LHLKDHMQEDMVINHSIMLVQHLM